MRRGRRRPKKPAAVSSAPAAMIRNHGAADRDCSGLGEGNACGQHRRAVVIAHRPPPSRGRAPRLMRASTAQGRSRNHLYGQLVTYVQLGRLEKAGLVARQESAGASDGPDRKVYQLTPAGQERVTEWLSEVSWPKPDLAEFHLKLIVAAQGGLADPIGIVDRQRRARPAECRRGVAGGPAHRPAPRAGAGAPALQTEAA